MEEPDEELEVGDSLEGNKLDSSEANKLDCSKLKDISDFSDSSGFQEMSSSLLNKQEWVGTGGVSRVLNFLVEKKQWHILHIYVLCQDRILNLMKSTYIFYRLLMWCAVWLMLSVLGRSASGKTEELDLVPSGCCDWPSCYDPRTQVSIISE